MRSPIRLTPIVSCPDLGADLKLENLQRTGSFKLRGAWRKLQTLSPAERGRGVITASAGNHGAGLALAASSVGIGATVVVPEGTPRVKRRRIEDMGARIVVHGAGYDLAAVRAHQLSAESGAVYVSAYDDDEIIAGNGGDLAREILEQCPAVRRVVAPIGGGGMIAGLAEELCPRDILVCGAQPAANCAMFESLATGRALTDYEGGETVAEGCEGAVAERTYRIVARHQVEIALVSEEAIERAVFDTYRLCGQVVECSAAVAVAALDTETIPPMEGQTVVVVSGGNIDDDRFDDIYRRHA